MAAGQACRPRHSLPIHARRSISWIGMYSLRLSVVRSIADGIPGRTLVRDLSDPNWRHDLASDYDVGGCQRYPLAQPGDSCLNLRRGFHSLRPEGVFLLMEPAAADRDSRPGSKRGNGNSPASIVTTLAEFLTRVNALLGCDGAYLGDPSKPHRDTLSVRAGLLTDAGFESWGCRKVVPRRC